MAKTNDLEKPKSNDHHYFASSALGCHAAETRGEALQKLFDDHAVDFMTMLRKFSRKGRLGPYLWSCKVKTPITSTYLTENLKPVGVETEEYWHHYITSVQPEGVAFFTAEQEINQHPGESE